MPTEPTSAALITDVAACDCWGEDGYHFPDCPAYEPRPWSRRIDEANPCTCPDRGFDRDCPRHGDVKF